MSGGKIFARHPTAFAFVIAAFAFAALKSHVLSQPPVWDTAMGVVPPAVWLHHHGFELAELVRQPAWQDGGPNVYSLSLVTWLTAMVIGLCGGTMAWLPIMHVLHLLCASAVVAGVFWLADRALNRSMAAFVAVATGLLPVFATQAGYLYLEMPLAAATVAALIAAVRSHHGRAAMWAMIAMMIKPTALVVVAIVVLAGLFERASVPVRVRRAFIALAGPAAVITVTMWISTYKGVNPWRLDYVDYIADCYHRMRTMPDVLAVLAFASLGAMITLRGSLAALAQPFEINHSSAPGRQTSALRPDPAHGASPDMDAAAARGRASSIANARATAVCCLAPLAFVGFVAAVPLSGTVQPLLPRHVVQIVGPTMIAGAVLLAKLVPRRIVAAGVVLACAFFVANAAGRFYPPEHRSFAVAERSDAYRDLLAVQTAAIARAETLPTDVAMFYPLPDHYFFSDPLLGYAKRTPVNGHCLRFEAPWRHGRLADFPPRFFLLDTNPYHGGETLAQLVSQAQADPSRRVIERWRIAVGPYSARILEVR